MMILLRDGKEFRANHCHEIQELIAGCSVDLRMPGPVFANTHHWGPVIVPHCQPVLATDQVIICDPKMLKVVDDCGLSCGQQVRDEIKG